MLTMNKGVLPNAQQRKVGFHVELVKAIGVNGLFKGLSLPNANGQSSRGR